MAKSFGWYVTVAGGRYRRTGAFIDWVPNPPRHLKRLGVLRTACGLSTNGWRVLWQERPLGGNEVCVRCLDVVAEQVVQGKCERCGQ